MRNKIRVIAILLSIVLVFFGCYQIYLGIGRKNTAKVQPEFVLRYGEVNSEGHIMAETAHYFADKVEELSDGKVVIEIYPSGQLGDDARCYQMMRMGALDLYRGNSASLTSMDIDIPMVSVMALPYLFRNSKHFWRVCNSELGKRILDDIKNSCQGMQGLAFLDEGARCFFTVENPIVNLSDIQGLNIRMQDSDIMCDTLIALGANAVPMEYVEVYSALKSKSIDGAENPAISYYYNKFYEVAPYYVKDAHTYAPGILLISEITWEKLGITYQEIIREAAVMAQEYNMQTIEEAEKVAYEGMLEKGVIITELTNLSEWQERLDFVYYEYAGKYTDIISEIKEIGE